MKVQGDGGRWTGDVRENWGATANFGYRCVDHAETRRPKPILSRLFSDAGKFFFSADRASLSDASRPSEPPMQANRQFRCSFVAFYHHSGLVATATPLPLVHVATRAIVLSTGSGFDGISVL